MSDPRESRGPDVRRPDRRPDLQVGHGHGHYPPATSRRAFLSALPAAALAGALACRRGPRPYDPARFVHPALSPVALLPAARYEDDLSDAVSRGLALLNVDGSPVVRAWNVVHTLSKVLSPAAEAFRYFVLERGEAYLAQNFAAHLALAAS